MRRVLALLIVTAATIAAAWWIAGLTGTVSATIAGTTIQTTTPVALVALLLVVLLVAVVVRVALGLAGVAPRLGRWRARRRREAGDQATTRTLVALASGDAGAARKEAARARRLLGDTPQTLLHAAEAARLSGHDDEAAALFRLLAARQDAGFLGLRGLFRQAMARKDWSAATAMVQQAEAQRPGTKWLRAERSELAVRTGNWTQAIALAAPDAPTGAYAVAAAEAEPDLNRAIGMAKAEWSRNPRFIPAALLYATKLRQSGRESRAQDVLRTTWRTEPHPDVADLAIAAAATPAGQLREATKLAQINPGHPESLFLLARLELADGRVDDALRHAEAARNAGMNQQRLYTMFAELNQAQPGALAPLDPQLAAMRLATTIQPDPAWHCAACGAPQPIWRPICPACDTPGRIVWGVGNTARGPGPLAAPPRSELAE